MYRIDEGTYIDTSLLTCAEYQLFIDEMREHGKNFQPDHWISYQYPEGHANYPIFGVRSSDAIAFLKWLTQRDERERYYRLPKVKEANEFPLAPIEVVPSGYWALSSDNMPEFIWINRIEGIDFALDVDANLAHILSLNRDINHNSEFLNNLFNAVNRLGTFDFPANFDSDSFIKYAKSIHAIARTQKFTLNDQQYYQLNVTNLVLRKINEYPAFEGIRIVKDRAYS
jgi:hypothetical protein